MEQKNKLKHASTSDCEKNLGINPMASSVNHPQQRLSTTTFIDESGITKDRKQEPVATMAAIVVPDKNIQAISANIAEIRRKYSLSKDIEIHASELFTLTGINAFVGTDKEQKQEQRNNFVFDILSLPLLHDIVVILRNLDKKHLNINDDPYILVHPLLLRQIDRYMNKQGEFTKLISDRKDGDGPKDSPPEKYVRNTIQEGKFTRFDCGIKFVHSDEYELIQLVDVIAFCIRKHQEIDLGYRPGYSSASIDFFSKCNDLIAQATWKYSG